MAARGPDYFELFPDEMLADVFCDVGRRSVPPMIVAVVMVLQRIEGCSDREAVDRFTYDARWKYAAGGLDFDYPGFVHTVLVDMRARLAGSDRPDRIFEVVLETAKRAGLVGRRRVLDSTALYDAVATMDTVTLVRSAVRGLLGVCDHELEGELRGLLGRDDDYRSAGKPVCDYDDRDARERSSMRSPRTPARCLGRWTAVSLRARSRRPRPCWRRSPARISTRARTACSDRAQGRQGPHHLDRRSRGPSRPQDRGPRL